MLRNRRRHYILHGISETCTWRSVGRSIGAVFAGLLATWGEWPAVGHEWYPIALAVLAIPQSWVGGRLREIQLGVCVGP